MLKVGEGGRKSVGVVFLQKLEVLAILKVGGGHKKFPPFKRGGGVKRFYPDLRVGGRKTFWTPEFLIL